MPYIKGMLHQVDFKGLFEAQRHQNIVDIWGKAHPVRSVDIILTHPVSSKPTLVRENNMTWEGLLGRLSGTTTPLYITNLGKTGRKSWWSSAPISLHPLHPAGGFRPPTCRRAGTTARGRSDSG